jgi:hypothetical protein
MEDTFDAQAVDCKLGGSFSYLLCFSRNMGLSFNYYQAYDEVIQHASTNSHSPGQIDSRHDYQLLRTSSKSRRGEQYDDSLLRCAVPIRLSAFALGTIHFYRR